MGEAENHASVHWEERSISAGIPLKSQLFNCPNDKRERGGAAGDRFSVQGLDTDESPSLGSQTFLMLRILLNNGTATESEHMTITYLFKLSLYANISIFLAPKRWFSWERHAF